MVIIFLYPYDFWPWFANKEGNLLDKLSQVESSEMKWGEMKWFSNLEMDFWTKKTDNREVVFWDRTE